jgi:hypothetical protein
MNNIAVTLLRGAVGNKNRMTISWQAFPYENGYQKAVIGGPTKTGVYDSERRREPQSIQAAESDHLTTAPIGRIIDTIAYRSAT